MTNDTIAESKPPFLVVLDEYGYYADDGSELKEALREMPGVPNAQYLVDDTKVFVFEKLVQMVSNSGLSSDGKPDSALVAKLLPQAWLKAEEATVSHGVVPYPYELHKSAEGLRIRHRPFNALLPGVYADESAAKKALATLLLGGVIAGEGQFEYRGQAMTLQADFDIATLPQRPCLVQTHDTSAAGRHRVLPNFHGGLTPLPECTYVALVDAHKAWRADEAAAYKFVSARVDDLWRDVAGYGINTLNDQTAVVPDHLTDEAAELRRQYPELSMLNDGSLCDWFDNYSTDCLMLRSWTPYRDDVFLLYLVGTVALGQHRQEHGDWARDAGLVVGLALLQGRPLHEALVLGADASRYGRALRSMTARAVDVVTFLAEDATADRKRGPQVATFMDIFRTGRSFNAHP